MKKLSLFVGCIVLVLGAWSAPLAQEGCITIQDGTLVNSDGELLQTGYDDWGYNYQAHMFNGTYCDAYRDAAWCQPYVDVELIMKWNDAWLSSEDCNGDGGLDRHLGYDTYRGSGAWLTNHQSGTYLDDRGKKCRWTYFVKIVAAPSDAVAENGVWYDGAGEEIGPVIWGEFAVIQRHWQDPCDLDAKENYKGLKPGLGNWEDDPTE